MRNLPTKCRWGKRGKDSAISSRRAICEMDIIPSLYFTTTFLLILKLKVCFDKKVMKEMLPYWNPTLKNENIKIFF